jgi:hypothetical protein
LVRSHGDFLNVWVCLFSSIVCNLE